MCGKILICSKFRRCIFLLVGREVLFFTEEHKNKFIKPMSFCSCFYKQNTVVVRGIPIRMDGGNLVVISGKKWLPV